MEEECRRFLGYIHSTWSELLDTDWVNEPKIKDIIVNLFKGEFTVFVSLENNSYYAIEDGELIQKEYDSDKYIKTTYCINEELLLYILLKKDIIEDLGLKNTKIFVNPCYMDYIPVEKQLSKRLEKNEESYAETLYCIEHDL